MTQATGEQVRTTDQRDVARALDGFRPTRLAVVIVCYRAVDLTIDCLESLEPEIEAVAGAGVIVCENGTGGDSVERFERVINERGWRDWVRVVGVWPNRGFSGGNNAVLDDILTWGSLPEYALLLNADTVVRPGALGAMLAAADADETAGVVSPRLEWPDGTPQVSCFRDFHPLTEIDKASGIGAVTKVLNPYVTAIEVSDEPSNPDWTSFACAMIRRDVLKRVGVLDPGFFLYFDDPDYCRRVRKAGYSILNVPSARVVHLRGKSNPAKELAARKARRPWYHFASRTRYYAKHYGRAGLLVANIGWTCGHVLARVRSMFDGRATPACEREARDIWTNFWRPLAMPTRGQES